MSYIWNDDNPPKEMKYIIVDKYRHIHIPLHLKTINVTGDNNAQTLEIKMNRYYDGIDLSQYKCVICYVNAGNEYGESDVDVIQEEQTLTLSWCLTNYVTRYHGEVKFTVQFRMPDLETSNYQWQTVPASLIIRSALPIEQTIIEKDDVGFKKLSKQMQEIQENFQLVLDKCDYIESEFIKMEEKVCSYDEKIELLENRIKELEDRSEFTVFYTD